jgi:hypothetical protein
MTMTDENPPVLEGGEYELTVTLTLKDTDQTNPISETIEKHYHFSVDAAVSRPVSPLMGMSFSLSASDGAERLVDPSSPAGQTEPRTISTLACTHANILSVFRSAAASYAEPQHAALGAPGSAGTEGYPLAGAPAFR